MTAKTANLTLNEGATLITLDGDEIGRVKEVRGDFLKVDASWRRDYWLPAEYVHDASSEAVRLIIPTGAVKQYKLPRPEHREHRTGGPGLPGDPGQVERDMMLGGR